MKVLQTAINIKKLMNLFYGLIFALEFQNLCIKYNGKDVTL